MENSKVELIKPEIIKVEIKEIKDVEVKKKKLGRPLGKNISLPSYQREYYTKYHREYYHIQKKKKKIESCIAFIVDNYKDIKLREYMALDENKKNIINQIILNY